ncbi:MAG TPA: 6-phosphogluconolactonase, partial [Firmicutes bacterium]|nr:6-phosphogluconolactonase [Bacillota bacterium]
MEFYEFSSTSRMNCRIAEHIEETAVKAVKNTGSFTIALSGGMSPEGVYKKMAGEKFSKNMPWEKMYVFWGDERYVPISDSRSNYKSAQTLFLSKVPIPPENILRFPVEIEPVEEAALLYERMMMKIFVALEKIKDGSPKFDMVLLGMGRDGHTASLFPGHEAVNEKKRWVTGFDSPVNDGIKKRITMTIPVINAAENVSFIVSGEGKGRVLRAVKEKKG